MPAKPPACDLLTPNVSEWSVSDRSPVDTLATAGGGAHLVLLVGPWEPATGLDVLDDLGLDAHEVASAHEPSAEPGKRTPLPLPPGRYAARVLSMPAQMCHAALARRLSKLFKHPPAQGRTARAG